MYSDNEKVVLCGASAYEQKYYFNQDFASLPQSVQDELHVMCVMFTVEIGGIFTMWFDSDGSLQFETEAVDADAMYDEIGGALRIKQYQEEKKELLESLGDYGKYGGWILLGIANVMFFCYDFSMGNFPVLYRRYLKPRISPRANRES